MATKFAGVPEWPDRVTVGDIIAHRHDNSPPLEERLLMDFSEALAGAGITQRVDNIIASAGRAPPCTSDTIAGQIGDLVKMARVAQTDVEAERERLNRPILTAQRSLKAKADGIVEPMGDAISVLKTSLNSYMAEESRKAAVAQRIANEEADAARKQAEAKASLPEYAVRVEAAHVPEPIARGDLGARVGTKTVWKHKIASVRQLPDAILKNEKVIEALDKVIAAQIRGGTRTIKGVEIWDEQVANVT